MHWVQQDQMLLNALISSLTKNLIAQVVVYFTSREVWLALERLFSSHSRAHIMQMHFQLATLKKGGSSISDYYQKFKSLFDGFAAAGQSLNDYESFLFLLSGLGTEVHSVVASLSTLSDTMPIEDLYSHLLIHEQRLEHHSSTTKPTFPSANLAAKQSQPQQHGNGKGRGQGHSFNYRGRGRGSPPLLPIPTGDSSRPICQVCFKAGHTALTCYNKFNHAYQRDITGSSSMQAYVATPAMSNDLNWYPDTGTTHHITSDVNNLNLQHDEYSGPKQVYVGNGQGLPIHHLGSSSLSSSNATFLLNNVLHVP
jgi:hypothetical protein